MRRPILISGFLSLLAMGAMFQGAVAQTSTGQTSAGLTILHLSETATVTARPEDIIAELRTEAQDSSAQAAQSRVNTLSTIAVAEAKRMPGITVSTGGYGVYRVNQPREMWQASQRIRLRGTDSAKMMELVGTLQGKGLVVSQLGWELSEEQARKLRLEATKLAITGLRGRAEEAAGLLGLRFVQFRDVQLDAARPAPMMLMRASAAPSAGAPVAAPVVEAEDVRVSATVGAEAELRAP